MCQNKRPVFLGLGITQIVISLGLLGFIIYLHLHVPGAVTTYEYQIILPFLIGGILACVAATLSRGMVIGSMIINIVACMYGVVYVSTYLATQFAQYNESCNILYRPICVAIKNRLIGSLIAGLVLLVISLGNIINSCCVMGCKEKYDDYV